jgi:uncharacterized membrane protein YjjP (DUF1212 family)
MRVIPRGAPMNEKLEADGDRIATLSSKYEVLTTTREALQVAQGVAELLFVNGQTTRRTDITVRQLGVALGFQVDVFQQWGELLVRLSDGGGAPEESISAVAPVNVDMRKVASTMTLADELTRGELQPSAARAGLESIRRSSPPSLGRFVGMAATGAAALGVIFGAAHWLSLALIAFSAGVGAGLRRAITSISPNPFFSPFAAALVAGVIGGVVTQLHLSSAQSLIAVCPCMILVPGPHLLNGAIDLVRSHIALGVSRIAYASLIILMICTGLLAGLAICGVPLSATGTTVHVPLGYDVLAAGVAVAAYGSFFSMPWRMLPIPTAVGMLAHAARWVVVSGVGLSAATGAFVACLIVSAILTPVADRLRLPFAALAFASVVSLIPGVFLFRMSGGLVSLVSLGAAAPPAIVQTVIADGATAAIIMMAMTFGLIIPKLCLERR